MEDFVKDPKLLVDCSGEVDAVLGQAEVLKNAGRLNEALDLIYPLEKKARNGCDGPSVGRLVVWAVSGLLEEARWEDATKFVISFAKKRGQLIRAVTELVRTVMAWLDKLTPELVEKSASDKMNANTIILKLIETLCVVTEGRIYVEVERARVILRLAKIKEAEGNIIEAANLLQEVQIETSISMDPKEKTDFILEQMRLVLAKEDFIRCQIVCKRINKKSLNNNEFQIQKLRYYNYMIQYHLHQKEFMEISECMRLCLDTPAVSKPSSNPIEMAPLLPFLPNHFQQTDLAKWYLEGMVIFVLLSSHSAERRDVCLNIQKKEAKGLEKTPAFKTLLEQFLNQDLIKYPPPYLDEVIKHPMLQSASGGQITAIEKPLFYTYQAEERRVLFRTRIIQHNLIIVSTYYKRTYLKRLSEMFDVPEEEVEAELCELISSKSIHAKISRSTGVIEFQQSETVKDRMDDWSQSISSMLDILEETSNLLEKEKLLQKTHFAQKGLART